MAPINEEEAVEIQYQEYERPIRIINEKAWRVTTHVSTLEKISEKWLNFIERIPIEKKDGEEKKYEVMSKEKEGILELIEDGREAIVTLDMLKEDLKVASLQRARTVERIRESVESTRPGIKTMIRRNQAEKPVTPW